jgi:quercetin dioxygenase-like cupin family protein
MQAQGTTLQAFAVGADEGEARWWGDGLAVIKATAAQTGGLMTIVEITEPAGAEAPLHVHHHEDEGIWILEGSATFEVDGARIEARAGDYVFSPRNVPHRYTVGEQGCRMLFMVTPGGFENLVIAMSEPAPYRTLPPPGGDGPDIDRLQAIAAEHGGELIDG